ncbi:hypothetical protein ISF6_3181 [Piscinibacter sakaiensis]|uniref:Uncharacterized protein n=1 Tax=Piscinibacter sakaiensis TaxID=1547922 RepID=A0A0K8P408_PISS1|nr:hypothetical protein ISF6_3181 [Piscinibacter sakaiensis]
MRASVGGLGERWSKSRAGEGDSARRRPADGTDRAGAWAGGAGPIRGGAAGRRC